MTIGRRQLRAIAQRRRLIASLKLKIAAAVADRNEAAAAEAHARLVAAEHEERVIEGIIRRRET